LSQLVFLRLHAWHFSIKDKWVCVSLVCGSLNNLMWKNMLPSLHRTNILERFLGGRGRGGEEKTFTHQLGSWTFWGFSCVLNKSWILSSELEKGDGGRKNSNGNWIPVNVGRQKSFSKGKSGISLRRLLSLSKWHWNFLKSSTQLTVFIFLFAPSYNCAVGTGDELRHVGWRQANGQ
jgi:hypothetical protein